MGNELRIDYKIPVNKLNDDGNMIKIDRLFDDKITSKSKIVKRKMMKPPSFKTRTKYSKRNSVGSNTTKFRGDKITKQNVSFVFNELNGGLSSIESGISEYNQSNDKTKKLTGSNSSEFSDQNGDGEQLEVSQSSEFELNQICNVIDDINRLCMEPIKVKVKRDYLMAKNSDPQTTNTDDLRYSADINIVLSNRKDNKPEPGCTTVPLIENVNEVGNQNESGSENENNKNDFSLTIESISDSSKSDICFGALSCLTDNCLSKQTSGISNDSVRSLDKLDSRNSLSRLSEMSKLSRRFTSSDYFGDNESSSDGSNNSSSDNNNKQMSYVDAHVGFCQKVFDKPYYGRTLFYRVHESHPNIRTWVTFNPNFNKHFLIKDPNCMTPSQLGFDSIESLNSSLNARSEVIIKPPVTIGRSISFMTNMCKSVLKTDKFITDSVFQINWSAPKLRRRKSSLLGCC